MAGLLDGVDQRTQLAGHNRMELLLFKIHNSQRYGINVFKVQEVIQCPALTQLPKSHPSVRGVAHMRGKTIPVIDLSMAIGLPALDGSEGRFVIITEYNRSTQGFLVGGVDKIVNMKWEDVLPPPQGAGLGSYMTAVTQVDGELVEIIDVEKILSEVNKIKEEISETLKDEAEKAGGDVPRTVLVADDSLVARKQIKKTLDQIGMQSILVNDGKQALDALKEMSQDAVPINDQLLMVISDVEMPEMDGYTLTTELRKDEALKPLHIILHTSLSGVFNSSLIQKVGADLFVAKFDAEELGNAVLEHFKNRSGSD